eukprot:13571198-Ditylum_brightwellii.AAC.1
MMLAHCALCLSAPVVGDVMVLIVMHIYQAVNMHPLLAVMHLDGLGCNREKVKTKIQWHRNHI